MNAIPKLLMIVLSFISFATYAFAERRPFPTLQKLPSSPDSFCAGMSSVFAITTQEITREVNYLCRDSAPTTLFRELFSSPYNGSNQVKVRQLLVQQEEKNSRVIVAFSTKIPLSPVKAILQEEKNTTIPYKSKSNYLELTVDFIDPPKNSNDADTVFGLRVRSKVRSSKVNFDDTVNEYLKFYRMHPNNFDYFFAARTLIEPSSHSIESNTLRGFMPDPNDANATIAVSVFNFLMATPEKQHEALVEELIEYSYWSMSQPYH